MSLDNPREPRQASERNPIATARFCPIYQPLGNRVEPLSVGPALASQQHDVSHHVLRVAQPFHDGRGNNLTILNRDDELGELSHQDL